jgi:uncharacterized repeat protein (TIGR03803 family)
MRDANLLGWQRGTTAGKATWAVLVACLFCATPLSAQTITRLHSFSGPDGADPTAGLVQTTDGNLYGTTNSGGPYNDNNVCYPKDIGCGTIFRMTPSGTLTTVYSFCAQSNCSDGANPQAGLVQAGDGNLYGTTYAGGAVGGGTVFRISLSGELTTIYNFCSQPACEDGAYPVSGLIQARDGELYGTAEQGGFDAANSPCDVSFFGCGTVFKITLTGTMATLYTFCSQPSCVDGANPAGGLIQAADGNFYGTTIGGGSAGNVCDGNFQLPGCGTVFRLSAAGALTTLYSFCSQTNCADGTAPRASLVQASDGDFYGTTWQGGDNSQCPSPGCGTVFLITPTGTLTTLHRFTGQSDGGNPQAPLIQATDGSFYGTTAADTVFKITPKGSVTTYPLTETNGLDPEAAVVQDTLGSFYGTASAGGTDEDGTVFALSVGLRTFVETQPTSARVGQPVNILGTALTGATSVTFNGTAAAFTVVSPSLIRATVPEGATTGSVQVVTGHGTLTSNVPFHVVQ